MQGYMYEKTYDTEYFNAPGFKGFKAQPCLDGLCFNEDAGYGVVFFYAVLSYLFLDFGELIDKANLFYKRY